MWHKLEFETKLEQSLIGKYGDDKGSKYFTRYASFRDSLIDDNALRGIPAIEPGLTDHSEEHIAHVMDNVHKLLGEQPEKYISPLEHYCLALMILFHDTGNLFKRDDHPKNVFKVYDFFKGNSDKRQERSLIIRGTAAHGGIATDGTDDTLKLLSNEDFFEGEIIRLRELAALLRFGDELAEGLRRTSLFMQKYNLYPQESSIYHEYARIIDLLIDRNNGRVSIAYNFEIDSNSYDEIKTKKLIDFSIKRLLKLDIERGYNKNYSDLLNVFKNTVASFNIWIDGILIPDLGYEKIELKDIFPIPNQELNSSIIEIKSKDLICEINKKINYDKSGQNKSI